MTRNFNDQQQIYVEHDKKLIACEYCGSMCSVLSPYQQQQRQFEQIYPTVHSMMISYPIPGEKTEALYEGYTCKVSQHYGCCYEHALLATLYCAFKHLHEQGNHASKQRIEQNGYNEQLVAVIEQLIRKEFES